MEEIDRCHNDNYNQPFFINMLGGRYGWIPNADEIPEDIRLKYDWVPKTSITFMEILHAAYRRGNPNAAFFFRDESILDSIPYDLKHRFTDSSTLSQLHLKELRRRLKLKFADQVFDYTCGIEKKEGVDRHRQIQMDGLERFAEYVLKFLQSAIEMMYPSKGKREDLDEDENENEQHKSFVERKAEMCIGRGTLIDQLMDYAKGKDLTQYHKKGEEKAFVRDPSFWEPQDDDSKILVLTGAVGYGKSCILTKLVQIADKKGLSVFYHFVGSSPRSYQSDSICRRLLLALSGDGIEPPDSNPEPMKFYMEKMKEILKKHRSSEEKPILLIIDGLNELNELQNYSHLSWLPPSFPHNIRCVVSSADDHLPTTHRLKEHDCFLIELSPIDKEDAREIVTTNLKQYGKRLDNDHLEFVVNQACSQNPLWLWLLCERLRVFGDFRGLEQRVKKVSQSVNSLISTIITDLVTDDDTECMTKFLCLVATSQNGIPTNDMVNLLGNIDQKLHLPHLHWCQIRRLVQPYIRTLGIKEVIVFKHSSILQNVRTIMLTDDSVRTKWHKYLVQYYLQWCQNQDFSLDNILYHCKTARLKKELLTVMRKDEISCRYPVWIRSHYLQQICRCRNMADSVLPATRPVVLCHRCSMGRGAFFPRNTSINKDSCIICGNHLFQNQSVQAYICIQHSTGQTHIVGKCILCPMQVWRDEKGNIKQNLGTFGYLCSHCSLGPSSKRCSYLLED